MSPALGHMDHLFGTPPLGRSVDMVDMCAQLMEAGGEGWLGLLLLILHLDDVCGTVQIVGLCGGLSGYEEPPVVQQCMTAKVGFFAVCACYLPCS